MLAKINDNAYKIELPEDYGVSLTFNVADLSPFLGSEAIESRMTHFQEGENDVDLPTEHAPLHINHPSHVNQGPLIRSHAKKLQQQVTSLLAEFNYNISKNVILPKCYTLIILWFKHEDYEDPQVEKDEDCMDYMEKFELASSDCKIGPQVRTAS